MPRSVLEMKDINLADAVLIDAAPHISRVTLADEKSPNARTFILKEDLQTNMDCPAPAAVLVSDLYRLWAATPQPRTQLVEHNTAAGKKQYLLTEESKDAQPYLSGIFAMRPSVRAAIDEDKTAGLAALLVIALTVGQGYLRKLALNNKNQFIQNDFNEALCLFWHDHFGFGCEFEFYSADLQVLPLLRNYAPFQWLDIEFLDDIDSSPFYSSNETLTRLRNNPKFLAEKYQTILIIILTPANVISDLADSLFATDSNLKSEVVGLLKNRINNLEKSALAIPSFRKYLFKQTSACIHQFLAKVKDFPALNPEAMKLQMLLKFNLIKSPEHFEYYISQHKTFSTRYKRFVLKDMVEKSLHKASTFDEVMSQVAKIRHSEPYLILKQRQGLFRMSWLGTQYDGVEVSESFDNLILLAKNQLISIAKAKAYAGDKSLLRALSQPDNSYGKLIHMQRYRFFADETYSAALVRDLLAADLEDQSGAVEMLSLAQNDDDYDDDPQLAARRPGP